MHGLNYALVYEQQFKRKQRNSARKGLCIPYARSLANHGWKKALQADASLALGLNTHDGELTSEPVAVAHGMGFKQLSEVLS